MEGLKLGSFRPEIWWFAAFLESIPSSLQTCPSYSPPSVTGSPTEGMLILRGLLWSTAVIPIRRISATSPESIVRPPVRTEGMFSMFPSNQHALYVSWYLLIILGTDPSSTCDVVLKMPSSSPSLSIETTRCLINKKSSKSSWENSRQHTYLSRELNLLHTLLKEINSETQWYFPLLGYFCRMVQEVWRKRLKK